MSNSRRGRFLVPILLLLCAILAFGMGTVFRLRLLPFLRPNTILSGGKQVSTEQFVHLISTGMYVAGVATTALAVAAFVSLIGARRKIRSRREGQI
jgi:hypothetical protein